MIVTGYIIGLSCLFLISYRTLIAFFSESKAVTIYINRFSEQFIDIFALIILWIICLVGLIYLRNILKKEKPLKQSYYEYNVKPLIDRNKLFYEINNNISTDIKKSQIISFPSDSSDDEFEKIIQQFRNSKDRT